MQGAPKLPSGLSATAVILGLVILLGLYGAASSYVTVPTESVGVVLRFGKYVRTVNPGLHFKIPFGIEHVDIVPNQRQLKLEFGYTTPGATNLYQYSDTPELESPMVTGDLNAALVEWVVQYRISDPFQYLFYVRDPALTLRSLSESVMREVVGDRTIDEVLTFGRQEMEVEVLAKLQEAVSKYELGAFIDQVQLKNVNPPKPVQASFDEVNRAQQEREESINNAKREYNRVIPLARGEASQKILQAEGYALERVNQSRGDIASFTALLAEYGKAPEITRTRLYLETMSTVMSRVPNKVILDEKATGLLPLLQLQPGTNQNPAPTSLLPPAKNTP